jgi:hypothetical protein
VRVRRAWRVLQHELHNMIVSFGSGNVQHGSAVIVDVLQVDALQVVAAARICTMFVCAHTI